MKDATARELRQRLRQQHGVLTRAQSRAIGVSRAELVSRLRSGEWEPCGSRVLCATAFPRTPDQALWSAVLDAGPGAVASHGSAAWLWDLAPPPDLHAVIVARSVRHRPGLGVVHRTLDYPDRVHERRGLQVTSPMRTILDLAATTTAARLDDVMDRALASRLVDAAALWAEVDRSSRHGRPGLGPLRRALVGRRSLPGDAAHSASVLEHRARRLFGTAGLTPLAVEQRLGPDGRYRVDFTMAPRVLVEVDGWAYHASAAQKAEDERRRNRLRLEGNVLLVYTWRDVVDDGGRVVAEIRRAIALARRTALS